MTKEIEAIVSSSVPKTGISIGFTLQLREYEPIKINVYKERSLRAGEDEAELTTNIAKEVIADIDLRAKDIVAKIDSVMDDIRSELEDEGR